MYEGAPRGGWGSSSPLRDAQVISGAEETGPSFHDVRVAISVFSWVGWHVVGVGGALRPVLER